MKLLQKPTQGFFRGMFLNREGNLSAKEEKVVTSEGSLLMGQWRGIAC